MSLIVSDLTHEYPAPTSKGRTVLHDINWTLQAGDQHLLRGVSGSGKTTLFNIIAGLMHPTAGQITLNDVDLYAMPEAKRDRFRSTHIGYVFQTHYLMTTLTALENVIMPMAFARNGNDAQRRERARDLLERVGLAAHVDYLPRQLSTGQRMRVAVARALANTPLLLLADEPTAALDADSAAQIMDLMQTIAATENAILIVSSHDPALLERFSTIANLTEGVLSIEEATTV